MELRQRVPNSYQILKDVDLRSDRRTRVIVLGMWAVLFVCPLVLGVRALLHRDPIRYLQLARPAYIGWAFVLVALLAGCRLGHVYLHAQFIRRYSAQEAGWAFQNGYLYAAAQVLYEKTDYLKMRLLPGGIGCVLLLVLTVMLSGVWAPAAYLAFCFQLAGSAEDLYFAAQVFRAPLKSLVEDDGLRITVYGRKDDLPQ